VTALGDAALEYAAAGYQVFPLRGKLPRANCPACEPRSPRYQPHQARDCAHELCHGLYAATTDPERIGCWWARWPEANIGARVPRVLFVLDVDPRHGGHQRLAELEAQHDPLPPTRVSLSGRSDGGQHRWFLHPGGEVSAARLGAGLDVKTHSGYVLLPPSRHPATGKPYRWAEPLSDPAPAPPWLRALLAPPAPATPAPRHRPASSRPGRRGQSVAERFNATVTWAGVLASHGVDLPRPRSGRRRCPLAAPRRQQPQERHHPPRPAVRVLPGHPLRAH
jgi:Bifunctional DNA primase/polymerase, N-terminal